MYCLLIIVSSVRTATSVPRIKSCEIQYVLMNKEDENATC